MRRKYEESDNPFVNTARFWADRIQSALESSNILSESDEAIVLAELKHRDPTFTIEAFSKELREYIVPEVVESFVYWNEKEFGKWASEAVMSKTLAHREAVMEGNLTLESKLLDIRGIEVKGEMVDETPVLIVYFNTQQTEVVRNKIGDIVGGSPVF